MKIIKKLCIFLLAFSLVLPIFSNIKVKADTSFSLENMSEDEIVDLIFDSCKGIYPKEGQTTEEWATLIEKNVPFIDNTRVNTFKTYRWNKDSYYDFINGSSSSINHFYKFIVSFGNYAEAMDGSYHLSENDSRAKYISIRFNIENNYKKANALYDKLVKKLDTYYKDTINDKNVNNNLWHYGTISDVGNYYHDFCINNDYSKYYCSVLELQKYENYYSFCIMLVNPSNSTLLNDFGQSMINDSDEFSFSDDEDEFSFDDEIELDDPVIKSIINKKGKKLVVKYSGDDSFDNEVYKIQISTNKNFKSSKEFETKKTSATISKLKKGKTYYVRIMYIVTEDGETVSSNWSRTKSIKIKK